MSCSCNLNQTPKESYEALRANSESLGTGLFLIPAPDKGILEFGGVIVPHISHSECAKRGETCIAFKWIADSYKSYEELMKERAATRGCLNPDCIGTCTDLTCICRGGTCYKV